MKIAVLVGSLRADSLNKKLARTLEAVAPNGVEFDYVSIDMPLFNQELEANFPEAAQKAKDSVRAADGVLFVTPEYNRSIPGVLKNAIDWMSRPYGDSAFKGKPVGIVGAASGPTGTTVAQSDLRHVVAFLEMKLMGQPEVYLANAGTFEYDENDSITDERWRKNLETYMATFAAWVEAEK